MQWLEIVFQLNAHSSEANSVPNHKGFHHRSFDRETTPRADGEFTRIKTDSSPLKIAEVVELAFN